MYPAAPPPPRHPGPVGLPWAPVAAAAVLTVATTLLGLLPWPRPERVLTSSWQVDRVPVPLAVFLICTAAVCIAVAVVLLRREAALTRRDVVAWLWAGLLVVAAAALVWNALYAAALSTVVYGAVIPVFDWLFTLVPALLAGWLFTHRSRRGRWAAALGTGVVTVPLFALSWALLHADGITGGNLAAVVWDTAVLGVAPLAGGVALAGAMGARTGG